MKLANEFLRHGTQGGLCIVGIAEEAEAANLPIGSGEIESSNRSVVQTRLKLPGAWWKPEYAHDMLNLRTLRANGEWGQYWKAAG